MKKLVKKISNILLGILLLFFGLSISSCGDDQEEEKQETAFYNIHINNVIELLDENKIKIQFKLTDDEQIGVKGKTDDDFDVFEKVIGDDEDLTDPLEANRYIVPTPSSYAYASMIVMDLSGSVINDIEVIKSSSINYINNLFSNINSGNLKIGVYFFDGRTNLQEVIPFSSSQTDIIQAVENMNQGLQQHIQTALYHGVSQSCDLMTNQLQNFYNNPDLTLYASSIVVFSDGQNSNYVGIDRNIMNAKIQQTNTNTQFYCIAAGNDIDLNVVKNIGINGHFTITDYSKLNEGLNEVLGLIIREANSNYELEFCTAKRGINVSFRLKVKGFETYQVGQNYFNTENFSEDIICTIN